MSHFEAAEFENAFEELKVPNTDGFDFFTKSHNVEIYRKFNEESGLYQYKVYGELEDINAEICKEVYMDLGYRRVWDSYVKELKEVEGVENKVIYWNVNFPFPMSNRDYVYMRELREFDNGLNKGWVILARSTVAANVPEKSGVIRVTDYLQSMALTSNGKGGCKAFMWYYDNPKGMIPTWLINWAAKTGVPGFLTQMENACKGYADYCQSKS